MLSFACFFHLVNQIRKRVQEGRIIGFIDMLLVP